MRNVIVKALVPVCSGLLLLAGGCGSHSSAAQSMVTAPDVVSVTNVVITVTDSTSQKVEVPPAPRTVLALSSSIAELWLLAGGQLAGVTSDAISDAITVPISDAITNTSNGTSNETPTSTPTDTPTDTPTERDLGLPGDIPLLGTVKDPNMESILALQPDFVLLSQDITAHMAIAETLRRVDIPYYVAKVETLAEYLKTLADFTQITGDTASFARNGTQVKQEVDELLSKSAELGQPPITALFLRAYSSGVKAKAYEHTVCTILSDIGVENIAAREGFPLEDISMDAIIEADPDYILVVPMGDEEAAVTALEASLLSNPAFAGLSAVGNNRLIMLPKALYHYKPNNRWGEAYAFLLQIFYPQVFVNNENH